VEAFEEGSGGEEDMGGGGERFLHVWSFTSEAFGHVQMGFQEAAIGCSVSFLGRYPMVQATVMVKCY